MSLSKKPHETNIERVMREELERRGMEFEQFFPVRTGFIFDFAFPDKRLGIECDGERWHKPGNKRDRFRDYMLRRGDWRVMRFWGKEILENVSACVDRIEAELQSNRTV